VALVEGPVDGSWWGGGLGQGEEFELGGEGVDAALELPGLDGVAGSGERCLLGWGEHAGGERPLVRGAGGVVSLDDLGVDALA
jgi:hypothetical protein